MKSSSPHPWYQRVRRWGQTNLNEHDPVNYDATFWQDYWRRTRVQGVIVNAGGIVAYYPSQFDLHYRAQFLDGRDLFGEITAAARQDGLAVLARMDSNRATADFYHAHPDWFTVNAEGQPGMAGERYIACLNSPYTRQYLPDVLREIVTRYQPDGFTDNSWSGPGRNWICHCAHCQHKFHTDTGHDLPRQADWDDLAYRRWVRWSYACRTEIWDLNNRVTQAAGGPDCLWLGMVNGDPHHSHLSFCDLKAIGERAEILMSDQQGRNQSGFEQNAQSGKLLHGVLGWNKLIPESMAMYVRGEQAFRKASAPPLEAQKWMVSGFAGGISPWWHHVGAEQEDRRQFATALPLMAWHAANEDVLYDRQPVASVGVVWSHENIDFYGREQAGRRVAEPWRGVTLALTKARIPYLPVHADHIARDTAQFALKLLILPDLAVMSDAQCRMVRQFVENGGSLLATGYTSLFDADGCLRSNFGLADLLGVHHAGASSGAEGGATTSWEVANGHNYLRLPPSPAGRGAGGEGLFATFPDTAILPFGGTLQHVTALPGTQTIATYVPAFPIYPPEISWMRQPTSDLPAIVVQEHPAGGRIAYFAADIDRCYGRRGLPDHGQLLINAIHWAAQSDFPVKVEGPGFIDCHLYRQEGRLILHLVNLSGCNVPGYLEEHLPVGPLKIAINFMGRGKTRMDADQMLVQNATCRVSGETLPLNVADGWAHFELQSLVDHELIVLE